MEPEGSSTALLILVVSLILALAGFAVIVFERARQSDLLARGRQLEGREGGLRWFVGELQRRIRRTGPGRWLDRRLDSAGSSLNAGSFIALCLLVVAGSFLLCRLLLPPILSGVLALAALAGVFVWIERQRRKREEVLIGQLPELARTVSNGVSAGLSLPASLELASREMVAPAGVELRRLVDEQRLGRPLEGALESLRARMPSREVGVLVTTLAIQQRAGGDLVRALGDLGAALEERKDLKREVRTQMAGAVFTSYLVAGLGLSTLLILDLIQPGLVDKMLTEPLGVIAFLVSGTLYAIGFVFIRQVTRIDL